MMTATQATIMSLIRHGGALTINEVVERTGYCHSTVKRVLHGQQFAVIGRQAGQGPGAHVYDLAERASKKPEERPNPIVEQLLSDQLALAKAIRALSRRGHRQAAIDLAKLWLADDAALKRMTGGTA